MIIRTLRADRCWESDVLDIYRTASNETGVPLHWDEVVLPRIQAGEVLFAIDDATYGIVGFLQYQTATGANKELFWAEHMLYVRPEYRGRKIGCATALLEYYERAAKAANVDALLAGSTLHHNEHARKLYEQAGFKTNYTFKKDLK